MAADRWHENVRETDEETAYSIMPLGDSALLVSLGDDRIDERLLRVVTAAARLFDSTQANIGFDECVPAFDTIALYYDPYKIWRSRSVGERDDETIFDTIVSRVRRQLRLLQGSVVAEPDERRSITIPVCYGGAWGEDLGAVAAHAGLDADEVIAIHSASIYVVHMIGFAPGFPYLSGMPESIAVPRREKPRLRVPTGSVGIGGGQTGIYPISTPGGWHIIGRTPIELFRPRHNSPSLLRAGDRVLFAPIPEEQFENWIEDSRNGEPSQASVIGLQE